ncbi:YcaO-like family protein [Microbispora bryophytorum]|uniref:YcaO-like family protein n=1 Tax=Microbispora bryophytorum TaxID=1460882 RepID=UPI0033E92DDA
MRALVAAPRSAGKQVAAVIGRGAIARELAERLRCSARPRPQTTDGLHLVASWSGPAHLAQLRQGLRGRAWILVEETERGLAVGPVFDEESPCFECYLRRLASHGRPHPVPPRSNRLLPAVETVLARVAAGGAGAQLEILRTGGVREHRLLSVPGCACARMTVSPPARRLGPADAVSDRIGIVRHVEIHVEERWGVALAHARGCRTEALHGGPGFSDGGGCDTDPARAWRAAVCEALERYSGGFCPPGLIEAARDDLPAPGIAPDAHHYGGIPVSSATLLRWVRGTSLLDGSRVWVPAAAVFVPYRCAETEPPASRTSSEGLAAGPSLRFAVQRAALETVERDAFMRAWRYGRPVRKVPTGAMQVPGLHLAQIPTPTGAAVVAAFIEDSSPPFTAAGLAGRLRLPEAARAATLEALASRVFAERMLDAESAGAVPAPHSARYHRYLHATDARLRAARRRWLHPPRLSQETGTSWTGLVRRLPANAYIDLTPPDVGTLGIRVARVVVDGYVGLDADAHRPRLSGDPTPHPIA